MAAAATARKAAAAPAIAPRRKRAALSVAPARKAPARKPAPARRKAPARRPGGQLIPIAVGTASAVRKLPDSGLVVRMTRGRAWIGVLGVLLVGIVALNVVTLSLAASAGHIDQNIQALDEENSILRARDAQKSGAGRIRHEAAALGLSAAAVDQIDSVQVSPQDVETAARRLAAAGSAY
ncbi:MAG TPA: hypothetical protein VN756_03580 [Solirubrobacterales bacterium]|nr:hypothetical protein [Solirubrobacterales bacterium]